MKKLIIIFLFRFISFFYDTILFSYRELRYKEIKSELKKFSIHENNVIIQFENDIIFVKVFSFFENIEKCNEIENIFNKKFKDSNIIFVFLRKPLI
jgi:hypothetical protein